jgi:hypothetical protein
LLNINHTDPVRVGHSYWQVGEFKTINKIAAIERAGGDISKVKFQCMDDTWSRFDGFAEPTESWEELMKRRAWQLRDKYKHLAILYSGGWDSHTVLMTYINNNIPVDEIIIWDRTSYMEDPEVHDAYNTAKNLIKDNNLKTKLTMFDIPWDHHASIYKQVGENYIYLPGCPLMFNQTSRILHHETIAGFLKIKEQHILGSAVYIEAHDKPRVNLYDNKWYHFYVDLSMMQFLGKGASELFYYTPDMPELQMKQIYMSIRYFENLLNNSPGATPKLVHDVQSLKYPLLYVDWNEHLGRTCQDNDSSRHGLIKLVSADASSKRVDIAKLQNFTKEYVDEVYDIYYRGLKSVHDLTGIDVTKTDLPSILSKQYYVRDFKST